MNKNKTTPTIKDIKQQITPLHENTDSRYRQPFKIEPTKPIEVKSKTDNFAPWKDSSLLKLQASSIDRLNMEIKKNKKELDALDRKYQEYEKRLDIANTASIGIRTATQRSVAFQTSDVIKKYNELATRQNQLISQAKSAIDLYSKHAKIESERYKSWREGLRPLSEVEAELNKARSYVEQVDDSGEKTSVISTIAGTSEAKHQPRRASTRRTEKALADLEEEYASTQNAVFSEIPYKADFDQNSEPVKGAYTDVNGLMSSKNPEDDFYRSRTKYELNDFAERYATDEEARILLSSEHRRT